MHLQVVRAKKCLDFTVTMYLLHLLMVTLLAGFPKTLTWWACIDLQVKACGQACLSRLLLMAVSCVGCGMEVPTGL